MLLVTTSAGAPGWMLSVLLWLQLWLVDSSKPAGGFLSRSSLSREGCDRPEGQPSNRGCCKLVDICPILQKEKSEGHSTQCFRVPWRLSLRVHSNNQLNNVPFLAFCPSVAHSLHSSTPASQDHLPNKLPAPKPLFQALLLEEWIPPHSNSEWACEQVSECRGDTRAKVANCSVFCWLSTRSLSTVHWCMCVCVCVCKPPWRSCC